MHLILLTQILGSNNFIFHAELCSYSTICCNQWQTWEFLQLFRVLHLMCFIIINISSQHLVASWLTHYFHLIPYSLDWIGANELWTCLGAWMGAFVIPLDWDRPWQVWITHSSPFVPHALFWGVLFALSGRLAISCRIRGTVSCTI